MLKLSFKSKQRLNYDVIYLTITLTAPPPLSIPFGNIGIENVAVFYSPRFLINQFYQFIILQLVTRLAN